MDISWRNTTIKALPNNMIIIPEFEPFIRFHTFGDYSINFTVILRGREFVDQYLIKHEFVKKLHERFKSEGIDIPIPIRTVYLQKRED